MKQECPRTISLLFVVILSNAKLLDSVKTVFDDVKLIERCL